MWETAGQHSPQAMGQEGCEAWRGRVGADLVYGGGKRFAFRGPPGRSCDLQKLVQPTRRLKERQAGSKRPEAHPPLPLDLQHLLPIGQAQQKQEGKESLSESQGSAIFFNNGSDSRYFRFFGPKGLSQFCCLREESSHGQQ